MRAAVVTISCLTAFAGAWSAETAPPPRPAGGFTCETLDGGRFAWPAAAPGAAACVLFIGRDCPIANAYAPEVARIAKEYGRKGVAFAVAYPLADLSAKEARAHAGEYGFECPAVLDSDLALARRLGAAVTPEAVVLSARGEVLYRGRIDDRYPRAGGKRREVPTSHDLRAALDAAVAGKAVPRPWPAAVGCHIPFDK
ncbi:redoxin family protein [Gemmata sp.]|uniref:redoxin family protein n=1 Tax=Gemmata sp. TaxID=1914242 RepID=UPI003F7113D3